MTSPPGNGFLSGKVITRFFSSLNAELVKIKIHGTRDGKDIKKLGTEIISSRNKKSSLVRQGSFFVSKNFQLVMRLAREAASAMSVCT